MEEQPINQSQSFSFVQFVHHKPNYNFYKSFGQVKHHEQYQCEPNDTLHNIKIIMRTIQRIKKDRIRCGFKAIVYSTVHPSSSFKQVDQHPKEYPYHNQTIQQISSVEIINEQSHRSIDPQGYATVLQNGSKFIWEIANTKKIAPNIKQDWSKKTFERIPLSDCNHIINQPLIATQLITQNTSSCKYCKMLKQLKKKTYYLFN